MLKENTEMFYQVKQNKYEQRKPVIYFSMHINNISPLQSLSFIYFALKHCHIYLVSDIGICVNLTRWIYNCCRFPSTKTNCICKKMVVGRIKKLITQWCKILVQT